jgi:hypothetical protein
VIERRELSHYSAARKRPPHKGALSGPFPFKNHPKIRDFEPAEGELMLKSASTGEGAPAQINVVLNWFEELKQLVPRGAN